MKHETDEMPESKIKSDKMIDKRSTSCKILYRIKVKYAVKPIKGERQLQQMMHPC